jgi:hypothetical protein
MDTAFLTRTSELAILEDRSVHTGESTAIVSELPSGRTTLLRALQQRLQARDCRVAFIDVQTLDSSTTADRFWSSVLGQFGGARGGNLSFRGIERLLAEPGKRHILLIRDLQALVHLPDFRRGDPWGKLRSLTQTPRFTLVATSRIDLVALTTATQEWMYGSPFFNGMRELVLGPFTRSDALAYLGHHRPYLTPEDHEWILRCTGGHPKMLRFLGDALEQSLAAGNRGSGARLQAIAGCRQQLRVVLQNAWLFLPWQERWILLRTALAQRSAVAFSRPGAPLREIQDEPLAPGALIRLLESFDRDSLRRLLLHVLPARDLAALPGDSVSDLAYSTAAALLLDRLGAVPSFLRKRLELEHPGHGGRGDAHVWGAPFTSGAPWQPTVETCDRLIPRGILAETRAAPGLEITPPLLYWWILDQLHAIAAGTDLRQWLAQHGLAGHVSSGEAEALVATAQRMEGLLGRGAAPLMEAQCQ